jgi:glycosyltransferase involved in cell wall biosynthesis
MNEGVVRATAVGVVMPVHNEEELLGPALAALELACSEVTDRGIECSTAIVLDGCSDGSETIARRWSRSLDRRKVLQQSLVLRCRPTGVGGARKLGAAALLRRWRARDPRSIWLATTDADSRVPQEWLMTQLVAHEAGADVWTGRVTVEDWSPYGEATALLWNDAYDGEAVPVHGASLGFNAQTYLNVGGFAALQTGEDRALYQAILDAGGRTHHDLELRVITSGRRQARAPLGFAHALSTFDEMFRDGELIA